MRLTQFGGALAVALLIYGSAALAADPPVAAPTIVPRLATGSSPIPVKLARVVNQMSQGQCYGYVRGGVLCEEGVALEWRSAPGDEDLDTYLPIFTSELSAARIGDAPTGLNLFIPIGAALDALALKPGV